LKLNYLIVILLVLIPVMQPWLNVQQKQNFLTMELMAECLSKEAMQGICL